VEQQPLWKSGSSEPRSELPLEFAGYSPLVSQAPHGNVMTLNAAMNGRSSTSFCNLSFRAERIVKRSAESRNLVVGFEGCPKTLTFVVSHPSKTAKGWASLPTL
jgi:hypothetical protein